MTHRLSEEERQAQIAALEAMSDDTIDTADIPETSPENRRLGFRPNLRRPVMLDPDVLAWFAAKSPAGGSHTEINRVLRRHVAEHDESAVG